MKIRSSRSHGIALFILMSAVVVISLIMKDLITVSSLQAERVRNYADRISATYLARSNLNIARILLAFSRLSQKQGNDAADTLKDYWSTPVPFPVPFEAIQALSELNQPKEKDVIERSKEEELQKKCSDFFSDFAGTATATTSDVSALLTLNSLEAGASGTVRAHFDTLVSLLGSDQTLVDHMSSRGLNPDAVARQIRDFMDRNAIEDETQGPEVTPYSAARLDQGPKNRPFFLLDELKLVPAIDDDIFQFLAPHVTTIYSSKRTEPTLINLNTVDKALFQALLVNVASPEEVADKFIKDRKDNARIYTMNNLAGQLKDNLQIETDSIRIGLLTGGSNAFKIEVVANVGQTEVQLDTYVVRPSDIKTVEPIVLMRTSP